MAYEKQTGAGNDDQLELLLKIEKLQPETESLWRAFAGSHKRALFYASIEFRDLLVCTLRAEPHYLIALQGGECCGVLPAFASTHPKLGTVLNSLPFYGSNGGALTSGREDVKVALIGAYIELERELGCGASTLISSPLDEDVAHYETLLKPDLRDRRIGQLTRLPEAGDAPDERLFACYEATARRNVRKARKSGVTWAVEEEKASYDFLYAAHHANMRAIGGLPKERVFFEAVLDTLPPSLRRLYVARHEGKPIAALLTFRFGLTVEYYTPVIVSEYRSLQPLSLLVHQAMCEAAQAGYNHWNWGGTWATQDGVYRFKRKWGATDRPYHYFIRLHDQRLRDCTRAQLLEAFPGFYVLPFDSLRGGGITNRVQHEQ